MDDRSKRIEDGIKNLMEELNVNIHDVFLTALRMRDDDSSFYRYNLLQKAKMDLGITNEVIHRASFEEKKKLQEQVQARMEELKKIYGKS